ncbi:TPA: hypothetical protein ACGO6E_001831 [Streptococcus suis]
MKQREPILLRTVEHIQEFLLGVTEGWALKRQLPKPFPTTLYRSIPSSQRGLSPIAVYDVTSDFAYYSMQQKSVSLSD